MANPKFNYIMEVVMILGILFLATTAIIMWVDSKSGINSSSTLITLHHTLGTIIIILIVIHIILHFKFIIAMTRNLFRKKLDTP